MLALLLILAPQAAQFPVHEWVEVERVLDADTLEVRRAGGNARLRLLCIDAEERFHPGQFSSTDKPQTVFGEQTALWAEALLAGSARVGLCFPGGREEHDVFGRLLCHVVLADGRDYELELVRSGRSPYFNKYGNSEIAHAAFVAAQSAAEAQKLGIWNPRTNTARTPGVPSARRDYERLLPWWNARAAAVDEFRRRRAAGERGLFDAGDRVALEAHVGEELELFCDARDPRVRLLFPADTRAALEELAHDLRQNYCFARGRLERSPRGLLLRLSDPPQIRRAGR